MFVVAFVQKDTTPDWMALDTLEEALERYQALIDDGAYTVTLCYPLKSTDYERPSPQDVLSIIAGGLDDE